MRKKTDPKLIGAAILGTLALAIAAIVLFGSGRVVDDRPRAVIFFDGSVNGLARGAAVTLRGVQIGEVVDVRLRADFGERLVTIPVYVAFDRGRADVVGSNGRPFAMALDTAIQRGLRAQLLPQSVITGQLYVELSFLPDVPIRVVGADRQTPEIPAAPRILDQLKNELAALPLQQIGNGALRVLGLLDGLLNTPELSRTLADAAQSSAELRDLLGEVRGQVAPVGDSVNQATVAAAQAMADTDAVAHELKSELVTTLAQIRQTLKVYETQGQAVGRDILGLLRSADRSLMLIDNVALGMASTVGEGNAPRADLDQIIRNLAAATRALRGLAETLERNPNALITGRR